MPIVPHIRDFVVDIEIGLREESDKTTFLILLSNSLVFYLLLPCTCIFHLP